MQKHGNVWIYSPSDLVQFVENEGVTWLDRFDKERPGVLSHDEDSAADKLLRAAGQEHETAFLKQLIGEGREVVDLRDRDDRHRSFLSICHTVSVIGTKSVYRQ